MMISYDIYLFHFYSLEGLLNKLDNLKVGVKKYYKKDDYDFYLKINRKYRKLIKDNFKDFKIISKLGVINFFDNLFSRPFTLICLFLSLIVFYNLSNRVYQININGDYPVIEEKLKEYLSNNEIDVFSYGVGEKKINEVSKLLKEEFNDELEFIEVVKDGAVINLNYKKRRKELVVEDKKGSLYASKDGVIRGFSLSSGIKNVKVYDFVKKGDLLVSDILITSSDDSIIIGTSGKVFASTFYYIEVNCDLIIDNASKQAYMLDLARKKVSENINSDDEYIESENVLVNDVNKGYMKIYYVLYEDITI